MIVSTLAWQRWSRKRASAAGSPSRIARDDPKPCRAGDIGPTWWSCRFISVRAFCMCWMCEAAYPSRRSRWRSYAQFNDLPPWGGSWHAANHENGAAAATGRRLRPSAARHMLGIACIDKEHDRAACLKDTGWPNGVANSPWTCFFTGSFATKKHWAVPSVRTIEPQRFLPHRGDAVRDRFLANSRGRQRS